MNHSTMSGATYYTTSVVDSDSGSPTENGTIHFQNMTPVTYTSNNGTNYYTTTQTSVYGSPVMSNGDKNEYVVISNNSLHGDNSHHMNNHSVMHCHDIKEEVDSMGMGRSQHMEMGGNGNSYMVQQPTTSHGMLHQSGSQNDLYDYFVEQGNSNHGLMMQGNHLSNDSHLDLGLTNEDSLGSNGGLYHDDLNSNTHHPDDTRNSYDIDDDLKNEDEELEEQRAKEVEELEDILRKSNDIQRDVTVSDIKRGKNQKSPNNTNRKKRLSLSTVEERAKEKGLDPEALRIQIVQQNAKKAEAARMRYHRMNPEEKRVYNQRRTEAFRRRRLEEEMLLSTPAGRISQDALKKAQQIMMRNAKRAELARLRYHKMTPEERKAYNQRRSNAKRKRSSSVATSQGGASVNSQDFSINSDAGNHSEDNHFDDSNNQNINNCQGDNKADIKTEIDEHSNILDCNQSQKLSLGRVKQCSFDFPDGVCIFEETLRFLEEDVIRRTQLAKDALIRKKAHGPSKIGQNNTNKQQDLNMSMDDDEDDEIQHQLINQPGSHNTVMMHQQPVQMGRMNQIPVQQNIPLQTAQIVTVDGQNGQQYANLPPGAQVIILGHNQQFITTDELGHGTTVLQDGTKIIPVNPSNQPQTVYIQHLENGQIIQTIEPPPMQVIQMTDVNGQIIQQPVTVMPIRGHQQPLAFEQQGNIIIHQSSMLDKNHHDDRVRNHMYQEIQQSHSNSMHLNNGHQMQIIEMKNDCEEDTISPIIDQVCVEAANNDSRNNITDEKSEKLAAQRARRAARARQRYHQMSDEDRKKFNAKRAIALRKARQRDEELCQLYDAAQQTGAVIDEKTMQEIIEAQRRRSRRAEAARLKYQRMTVEERKEYNAMRDAQRRQRKRRLEQQQMKNDDESGNMEIMEDQHHDDDHDLSDLHDDSMIGDDNHVNNSNDMSIMYTQYEIYDNQMQSNWDA
uniref:BZIP domain-containing protein n=1 Tax=Parastrongyloides trichosuri TaxID=131310 RepID=A0A0N5A5B3_PARTI